MEINWSKLILIYILWWGGCCGYVTWLLLFLLNIKTALNSTNLIELSFKAPPRMKGRKLSPEFICFRCNDWLTYLWLMPQHLCVLRVTKFHPAREVNTIWFLEKISSRVGSVFVLNLLRDWRIYRKIEFRFCSLSVDAVTKEMCDKCLPIHRDRRESKCSQTEFASPIYLGLYGSLCFVSDPNWRQQRIHQKSSHNFNLVQVFRSHNWIYHTLSQMIRFNANPLHDDAR